MNRAGLDSLRTTGISIVRFGESSSDVYISFTDGSGLVGEENLPPDTGLAWSCWSSFFYKLPAGHRRPLPVLPVPACHHQHPRVRGGDAKHGDTPAKAELPM